MYQVLYEMQELPSEDDTGESMRNYFVCTFEVYKVGDKDDDGDGGIASKDGECAEYSHFFSKSTLHLSHAALSPGRLTP